VTDAIRCIVPIDLEVVLTPETGGGYSAVVPNLPGCVSEGDTVEEALANVKDAIQGCMAANADQWRRAPGPGDSPRPANASGAGRSRRRSAGAR
jgi:predicted RNase H-like HicB family nuclease